MKQHYITINRLSVTYFSVGVAGKQKMVFIPGIGGDWHGFEPYTELLKTYQLIFVDLPG